MSVLAVPYGLTDARLKGEIWRYMVERYCAGLTVQVFILSRKRCYVRVGKVLDRERNGSSLRFIERTFEYDIYEGQGRGIMEVPA